MPTLTPNETLRHMARHLLYPLDEVLAAATAAHMAGQSPDRWREPARALFHAYYIATGLPAWDAWRQVAGDSFALSPFGRSLASDWFGIAGPDEDGAA